jgi:hypothetical protein
VVRESDRLLFFPFLFFQVVSLYIFFSSLFIRHLREYDFEASGLWMIICIHAKGVTCCIMSLVSVANQLCGAPSPSMAGTRLTRTLHSNSRRAPHVRLYLVSYMIVRPGADILSLTRKYLSNNLLHGQSWAGLGLQYQPTLTHNRIEICTATQ